MKKLVSIIIPVYNDEKYIRCSIDSILNQSYKNIQLIIIDSSDDGMTSDILHSYSDSRICYFFQDKAGIANALNFGLEKATGDYIARMDADDISLPSRIEKQINFMELHSEISILGTGVDVIDKDGNVVIKSAINYHHDSEIKSKLIFGNCIMHPSVMMRAGLIKNGWRYDAAFYAEDLDLWTRMAAKGIKFANLKESLVLYRLTGSNSSSLYSKVSVSAAASAKRYVEDMFRIQKNKYALENYTRPNYTHLIQSPDHVFIENQLHLLKDIHDQNKLLHIIDSVVLSKELNDRWEWVYSKYTSVSNFCETDYDVGLPDDFFVGKSFLNKVYSAGFDIFHNNLLAAVEKRNFSFRKKIRVMIYGFGKIGKETLKNLEELISNGIINWSLAGVVDKKKTNFPFLKKEFSTIEIDEMNTQGFDFVIIASTKFYDEMKYELLARGVCAEKVLSHHTIKRIKYKNLYNSYTINLSY